MQDSLIRLSNEEIDLYKQVTDFKGTFQDREKYIYEMSIDIKYRNIFLKYHTLYKETQVLEALKRQIFIQWYAQAEPMAFTGINALDPAVEKDNIDILGQLICNNKIDSEFTEMIFCYNDITEWFFNAYPDFVPFLGLLKRKSNDLLRIPSIDRGQMGIYFNR